MSSAHLKQLLAPRSGASDSTWEKESHLFLRSTDHLAAGGAWLVRPIAPATPGKQVLGHIVCYIAGLGHIVCYIACYDIAYDVAALYRMFLSM